MLPESCCYVQINSCLCFAGFPCHWKYHSSTHYIFFSTIIYLFGSYLFWLFFKPPLLQYECSLELSNTWGTQSSCPSELSRWSPHITSAAWGTSGRRRHTRSAARQKRILPTDSTALQREINEGPRQAWGKELIKGCVKERRHWQAAR